MFPLELFEQGMNLHPDLRIKPSGGLVQKDELRIVDQSQSQRQPLFLTAGKRTVEGIPLFFQLQTLQQLIQVHVAGVERREHLHGFVDAYLLRQVRRLQANPDAVLELLPLPVGIKAENRDLTSRARTQPFQNLHRRRLARAIWSEQTKNFSRLDLKVDSFNGVHVAIRLLQTLHRDRWPRVHTGMDRLPKNVDSSQSCNMRLRHEPF